MRVFVIFLTTLLVLSQTNANEDDTTIFETQCGGTIETDNGVLVYPPESTTIPSNQTCIWSIHLQARTQFRYYFNFFDIPGPNNTNCSEASLGVFSLSNKFPDNFLGKRFCNDFNYNTGYHSLEGNTMVIILRTPENTTNIRFSLTWDGQQFPSNPTNHISTFTSTPNGLVLYPIDGEYPPNTIHSWLIHPSFPSIESTISVTNVDLEGCFLEDPCLCDALFFYTLTEDGSIQVADRFCGERLSGQVTIQGNKFIAIFFADVLDDPGKGMGFQFVWRSGEEVTTESTIPTTTPTTTTTTTTPQSTTPEPDPVFVTECGGATTGNVGKISYKPDEYYQNSERCAWIIRSPNHYDRLYLTKTRSGFELGKDYLGIYTFNKLDSSTYHLGKTTNEQEFLVVRGAVAVIVFTSDAGNPGQGFELEFHFNDTIDRGIELFEDYFSSNMYGSVTVGGNQPGDTYGNNVLSVFAMSRNNTYYTDIGWTATLLIYKMEDNLACNYDSVRVYSVAAESLNFVGRYCANSETSFGPFLATSLYIFVFASDGSVDAGGFEITWRLR